MTFAVFMIAFWQAVAVFVLCLVSKNRGYALLIGLAGGVVVSITGGNRYDGLDVLFVVVATLAAVWKLTPYGEGESRGAMLAFAGKAAGVVLALIVCGAGGLWYYANHGAPFSPPPVANVARTSEKLDDWVLAGSERGSTVYVKGSTLRYAENSVVVSVLLDFDEAHKIGAIDYRSLVFDFVTDCSTQKISALNPLYYSDHMSRGVMVFSETTQSPYEAPMPGSPFLKVAKTSCAVLNAHNAKK